MSDIELFKDSIFIDNIDVSIYFKLNYKVGDIISLHIKQLFWSGKYKNILFIRTCTTGDWLDRLLVDEDNITRILYYSDKIAKNTQHVHKNTTIIREDELEQTLKGLKEEGNERETSGKFDLICIDTWHEYDNSLRDFNIITSFLSENGMLISHDCFPWDANMCVPKYIEGNWSGEVYLAFVQFALNNPDMFYAILNIDTGIGIISKKELNGLFDANDLNKEKQETLLKLHNKDGFRNDNICSNHQEKYDYFVKHSKEIINAINKPSSLN